MKTEVFAASGLQEFLKRNLIGTLSALKKALGTSATMTIFRKLKLLGYLTSYSDRGKYYTLRTIPKFDARGLWSCRQTWFSRYGNLRRTVKAFVENAPGGWTAPELDNQVQVETKQPLLNLVRAQQIVREKIGGVYVYFSAEQARHRTQRLERQVWTSTVGGGMISLPEMKAAMVLFYSLLNEKQRRLYAGLESLRGGHGGDRAIAALLGLDIHTVAKGRRELFCGEAAGEWVRREGGGRKAVEKKRPKSSTRLRNFSAMTRPAIQ
ncbi:MAG: hypothetical protein HY360_26325 [Verrucomicrobia bacterium]|nr:hypothetical protein [Verrucomicrobiota bacterium]